jgi:hypothetical protein
VLLLSVYKEDITVIWFGFFAALIAFSGSSFVLGWHIAFLTLIGFISCHMREKLNLESNFAKLLLVFSGVLIHNLILLFISNFDNMGWLLLKQVIPGAIYTSVIAWIFFLFKADSFSVQKVKSIF